MFMQWLMPIKDNEFNTYQKYFIKEINIKFIINNF